MTFDPVEADRDRLSARLRELEALVSAACDIATELAHRAAPQSHPAVLAADLGRINEIRAALDAVDHARHSKEPLSAVRARHGFAPLSPETRAENLEANLADLSPSAKEDA